MQLVDGDYCTKVEHKCLRSWFDKSNKQLVCEQFEPQSRCVRERVRRRFCMDTYEWPNRAGQRPEVMNIFSLGFRCCAEADGKSTDFRTARQRKEHWKLGQLERKAGWTMAEVKDKLAQQAAGRSCGCDEVKGEQGRIKCRTICRQLLGPNAKDAVRGRAE